MVSSTPSMHDAKQLEIVMRYHEETKHHFNRYARALGYLDWANQPDPFRRFEGAPLITLPLFKPDEEPVSPPYDAIYHAGVVDRVVWRRNRLRSEEHTSELQSQMYLVC